MASEVDICNQALVAVGEPRITSLDDAAPAARWCKEVYADSRDALLEETEWSFAIERAALAPLAEAPDWGYSHQFLLPADCLKILEAREDRQVNTYNDLDWRREGRKVVCDASTIYIRYTRRVEDPSEFSPSFVKTLSSKVAWDISIAVAENRGLSADEARVFQSQLAKAESSDGQQGRSRRVRADILTRTRYGYGGGYGGRILGPTV